MERYSPGDVFGLREIYQQVQRIVYIAHDYQISCPLFETGEILKQWCPSLAVHIQIPGSHFHRW